MGASSSSLLFRETYVGLQKQWNLRSEAYTVEDEASVNERTRLFESCATDRSRNASKKLLSRGKRVFKCSPLLVEQFRLVDLPFNEEDKKKTLHPYTAVLYHRLQVAVSAEHAYQLLPKEPINACVTHFLSRWDYRIWMIACCEFFHVLAAFEASKTLPKAVKSFMKSISKLLKSDNDPALSKLGAAADSKTQYEFTACIWEEGAAIPITTELLTPKVLSVLKTQLPWCFADIGKQDGHDSSLIAKRLINLAREYEIRLEKVMNLHGSNPLSAPGIKESPTSLSFLAFVEWAALQCALSVCGPEENPGSYGVVQIEYSEKVLKHQNDAMHLWWIRLHRLETVEEQLAELELLGDRSASYLRLRVEQREIKEETEKLFASWRGSHFSLTAAEIMEKCSEMLDISQTLPDNSVHELLSSKAFANAIRDSDTETIDTAGKFRKYLKAYLALHDLYRDVLLQQLDASRKDGTYDISCLPDSVNFESFRAALWGSQMRHDIDLDPLIVAVEGGKGILSADEVAEVFRQVFNIESTERSEEAKVINFDAVCTTVAGDLVPAGETLVLRHPIEQLGNAIGLADDKSQVRCIASFLNQVLILSNNSLSNCGTALAAEALEAVVELPRYTDYSAGVSVMAIRFTCLSPPHWDLFAVKESPSSGLIAKWLHKIRSESADRLLLDDHINCHFFVRAFFSIAATQRAFEDTAPEETEGRPSSSRSNGAVKSTAGVQKEYEATESHFVRAVATMCKYLDCPAETLLHNCSTLLRQDEESNSSATAPQEASFTVEGAFSSLCKACGQPRDAVGADLKSTGSVEAEPMVSIKHVLFVVVSNYTRLHCAAYWQTNSVDQLNDAAAFDESEEPVYTWKDERALLELSTTMPLHCLNTTYREFAELTTSCAGVRDNNGNGGAENAFQQTFLLAFYEHYRAFFAELKLSKSAVAEIARRAFQYITSNPNRGGSTVILTRNDYSGFLQFVLGNVMMLKAYDCTVRDPATQAGLASDAEAEGKEEGEKREVEETFMSERDLRRMLECFTGLTDGGACNVPSAEEAQAWLHSRGIGADYEGFLSLDNALLWYGAHRIESYALESLFCWWKEKMAPRVPFTVSIAHRFARLSTMREILRIKQHHEDLPEDAPVELEEDEDGYLPVGLISYVMTKRMLLDEITLRVFHTFEQENADESAAAGGDGAEAQGVDDAFKVAAWVRSCVREVNAVAHRSDLESREVHHSDFRCLLQYVHHFVSAYAGLYYALTVLEASPRDGTSGKDLNQITGVSDEDRARLVDIFRQSVLPLLLPSGSAPAEMTSVFDTLLSEAWEEKRAKGAVADSTCQGVAHGIAALFVRHTHEIAARARHSYLDNRETQALHEAFTTERAFLGALGGYSASAKLKYWERLRLLLPFGPSLRHRERRRELYLWMDRRQRGYLTISDLAGGLMDLVQLQSFRVDFTPVLLRAFMATKEMTDEHEKIVYLTQNSEEQVLLPAELNAFLTYLYRYLELYFMFDVLTCGGHVHPETLHIVQKKQSYRAGDDGDEEPASKLKGNSHATPPNATANAVKPPTTAAGSDTSAAPRSGAAALLEAAKKPYQITLEAVPMKKEITLAQFRMGRQLLRKWGAHVNDPDELFYDINDQRRKTDAMSFIGFAIWASEHDLHPEGYGYGYDDAVDAIATMEEEYASM
ncbi:hypothetical protein ABB37_06688 [Leptomonas pyrrhocoris]|uniref:Flagellar calcium-binding protein n=1 Tax=Leptomonas pyrrhocoris TaxID=157538 RepID=A0A0N0VEB1_LEPPY|nr:hypothetical protein ABB37_06688 [Leptomonas pyrrhocoris]KPA77902.1 hypothetical protein ABB37_06688 [Leptomonas pyrrhocoris]|eukprot:XP_015656341.1 hypothetical protein ABB37_06688 [Leptomonas pyrrhocoris]